MRSRWSRYALVAAVVLALAAEAAADSDCESGEINVRPGEIEINFREGDCKRCKPKGGTQCNTNQCWAACKTGEPSGGECVECSGLEPNAVCEGDDGDQKCTWGCSKAFVKMSVGGVDMCVFQISLDADAVKMPEVGGVILELEFDNVGVNALEGKANQFRRRLFDSLGEHGVRDVDSITLRDVCFDDNDQDCLSDNPLR
ncbi:hypothetical protein T484DRAFT_2025241, partial [Baffinella frigidus]